MQGQMTNEGNVTISLKPGEKLRAPNGWYMPCKLCGTLYEVLDSRVDLVCFRCDPNALIREIPTDADNASRLAKSVIEDLSQTYGCDAYGMTSAISMVRYKLDEMSRVISERHSKIRSV